MRHIALILALVISGCASLDLKTVKESPVVYSASATGNHTDLSACMADALQDHEKFSARVHKYAVRNYTDKSEIQAYIENMYGGNMYLFTVELQQTDSNTVQVSLRRLEAFKEYVEGAIQSCSAQS